MSMLSGANSAVKILRKPAVVAMTGESKSTLYLRISAGLFTPAVSLGPRSVGWPEHEAQAILAARIAGKTEGDIKSLVSSLIAARKNAS
jgi:prophage regulatory protein